jgi:hypothetical protein
MDSNVGYRAVGSPQSFEISSASSSSSSDRILPPVFQARRDDEWLFEHKQAIALDFVSLLWVGGVLLYSYLWGDPSKEVHTYTPFSKRYTCSVDPYTQLVGLLWYALVPALSFRLLTLGYYYRRRQFTT